MLAMTPNFSMAGRQRFEKQGSREAWRFGHKSKKMKKNQYTAPAAARIRIVSEGGFAETISPLSATLPAAGQAVWADEETVGDVPAEAGNLLIYWY
jgi:hypothetical protein